MLCLIWGFRLKNEGGVLPLKPGIKIALIGSQAKNPKVSGGGSVRQLRHY